MVQQPEQHLWCLLPGYDIYKKSAENQNIQRMQKWKTADRQQWKIAPMDSYTPTTYSNSHMTLSRNCTSNIARTAVSLVDKFWNLFGLLFLCWVFSLSSVLMSSIIVAQNTVSSSGRSIHHVVVRLKQWWHYVYEAVN